MQRVAVLLFAGLLAVVAVPESAAQWKPEKPVEFVVPVQGGGSLTMRIVPRGWLVVVEKAGIQPAKRGRTFFAKRGRTHFSHFHWKGRESGT